MNLVAGTTKLSGHGVLMGRGGQVGKDDDALVTIITDGEENGSQE